MEERLKLALKQMTQAYPLPPNWNEPELFSETFQLGNFSSHLVGLLSRRSDGMVATASAAQPGTPPLDRAYFELLERMAVLDLKEPQPSEADTSTEWRFSRSNGVAAHKTFKEACRRAALELVERDCILRSWYGGTPPLLLPSIDTKLRHASDLSDFYRFEACLFEGAGAGTNVAGVFAFPRQTETPFVFGFGAASGKDAALIAAESECLQRLGFLWGEPIREDLPEFSPTPDYHQEVFIRPEGAELVRAWLSGWNFKKAELIERRGTSIDAMHEDVRFFDITPPSLKAKMFVVKALSDARLPLVFGKAHPAVKQNDQSLSLIHPIA